jgi:hypothetical protein
MNTYIITANTESGKIREAISANAYCELISKASSMFNACYFNWEIIKIWKLK